ncbi:restriction endonuclease subunit S [Alcanivorax sp.]|uniref:restriction endonuclease subunit S n=1 Tax=Alcanivorax sp. TaxID=1872427 RepID=UPI0025C479F6|nr:restriction endonuclease subunit S [Alcanivorax sp.]
MRLSEEFRRFPSHWDVLPFGQAVKDATSGNEKIQKGEYLDSGDFPIVDQGQSLYGGFTNNKDSICKSELPTIVFGDHTRAFKYIEEPFALGADGAKVLEPLVQLDKRFLFHYLKQLKIASAGYSRHFKFLKQTYIPVPPLHEQKRIATILDKADAIRRKRQQAIQLADELLRSVFLDMFGDPVTNSKGWKTSRVDTVCKIVRGSSPRPKGDPRYYGGSVPRLMVADLTRDGKFVTARIDFLTEDGAKKSRPTKKGTVVMAVSGNVGLTSILAADACIHDGFVAFNDLDSSIVLPEFLQEMMTHLKSTHTSRQAGAIFQNLTTSQIKEMSIPIPDIHLQEKYLDTAKKVDEGVMRKWSLCSRYDLLGSLSEQLFSKGL